MARGTQFSELVTRLRAELKRSVSVAVGVEDINTLKETLNHVYAVLAMQRDWAHLRKVFPVSLVAGDRYYDMPDDLDSDRVEKVVTEWGGAHSDVEYGIGFEHYEESDSEDDERSDPVQRWDLRWTGSETQIEVWPMPASSQTLKMMGFQATPRMVDDDDLCLLDDTLVVLHAAAELASEKDKPAKAAIATAHLDMLTVRMRQPSSGQYRLGADPAMNRQRPIQVVVNGG